jgi:hypothetical protein
MNFLSPLHSHLHRQVFRKKNLTSKNSRRDALYLYLSFPPLKKRKKGLNRLFCLGSARICVPLFRIAPAPARHSPSPRPNAVGGVANTAGRGREGLEGQEGAAMGPQGCQGLRKTNAMALRWKGTPMDLGAKG